MNTQEIFDSWARDEIDTVKTIVLLKARMIENNAYIKQNGCERDTDMIPSGAYDDPESGWTEHIRTINSLDEAELDNAKIDGFIKSVTEGLGTKTEKEPRIMWKGAKADLARLYYEMLKAGLIEIKGRDFSKHFCLNDGSDMPLDFLESKGTKQDGNSPKPDVMKVQALIRGMKPESGA